MGGLKYDKTGIPNAVEHNRNIGLGISGEKNGMYGVDRPLEWRLANSIRKRGNTYNKGKIGLFKHTEEFKQQKRDFMRGRTHARGNHRTGKEKTHLKEYFENTIWIKNEQRTEEKRLFKPNEIPIGWVRGRLTRTDKLNGIRTAEKR